MHQTPLFVKLEYERDAATYVNLLAIAEVDFHEEGENLVARVRYASGSGLSEVVTFHGQAAEQLLAAVNHHLIVHDEPPVSTE
ncbi:hypothetical protein Tter_2259 [Thermobaculum terrenum ATCC BAA-798]|uniref:Uncharacterized protein n=1 Tax=Thermobaculum terrenum (strain ATCC BAA-798 / CCMEE 7001 / YNP1) TaxID=525904 RepID=D1CHD7_THET1|nr:hypothetical protein [Thermobaculum terrenum]ACZ43158.1 hypothetical protein Tter_2259 [Thermobaculum terrenum ATCC BAA-798]